MGPDVNRIAIRGFSQAFEHMCNFVAVAQTGDPAETVKGLIQMCLVVYPTEKFCNGADFVNAIEATFGLSVPHHQVTSALDGLCDKGIVSCPFGTNFVLSSETRCRLESSLSAARDLEIRVKETWLQATASQYPALAAQKLWGTLKTYLCHCFRRHGMQATALLDPTIQKPAEFVESLSSLLGKTVDEAYEEERRESARRAISGFMAEAGSSPDRYKYLAQLADGAFNFYSLEIPPDLAKRMRSDLKELTLFLDTNFLFGILDLHHNSQTDVSNALLDAIRENALPFKLRYHQATMREMQASIVRYGDILRSRTWTKSLSRAAAASGNLSGIELKYHERNASSLVDLNEFLRPFEHFDVLLRDKGIDIYNPTLDRMKERVDLHSEYEDFLQRNGKTDKHYDVVEHDITVLDAVRQSRSRAASSLDAKTLLISCDYWLYKFDWESSHKTGQRASVLLPNIFWQILRPFVPSGSDFDRSFAETFSLPEFRVIGSSGSMACSKMLTILSTYRGVNEDTAFKLLSNGILLDRLKGISDAKVFKKQVDDALAVENSALLEEKAMLTRQLSDVRKEKEEQVSQLQQIVDHATRDRTRLNGEVKAIAEGVDEVKARLNAKSEECEGLSKSLEIEKQSREEAERQRAAEAQQRAKAEKSAFTMRVVTALSASLVCVGAFETVVHVARWPWLLGHDKSLSLQICFALIILFGFVGLLVKEWRRALWVSVLGGLAAIFLANI